MLDVLVVKPPGAVDGGFIFVPLGAREPLAVLHAMRRRRQNTGCTVGKPDTGAGERNLHHVFGEIAGRMGHRLIRSRNAAACRVVVGAEMSGDATARGSVKKSGQIRFSSLVEDRLCGFDHELESKQAFFDAKNIFERFEQACQRAWLSRETGFW